MAEGFDPPGHEALAGGRCVATPDEPCAPGLAHRCARRASGLALPLKPPDGGAMQANSGSL